MKNLKRNISRGMTLVEITIVLTVLMVVFGAVFVFFTRGSEEFDFSRRQNELITVGRMALEEVTDIILYAGYMPTSFWDNDDWHPVVIADSTEFEFYADFDEYTPDVLDPEDYRNIELVSNSMVVTDHASNVRRIGSDIYSLDFNYLDEMANPLPEPLSADDRDLVRHIQITLTMVGEYRGNLYYTDVSTTISPRNLGLNHNINPAFAPPDPLQGTVVFDVCGVDTFPVPNVDQLLMINSMIDWGLTVIPLTDYQMSTFDFIGEEIDLIVLRNRDSTMAPFLTFPYPNLFYNYTGIGDTLMIPVVTLNARDAVDIFSMGMIASDQMLREMTPAWIHPVNRELPDTTYYVYNPDSIAFQSVVDSLIYNTPGDTVMTYAGTNPNLSGICARDEKTEKRRIHFSAHDASLYTAEGWRLFYNVIKWNVGDPHHGTLVEVEDFENEEDYSYVDPGYGESMYAYIVSPMISIPPATDDDYEAILRFSHCYWTRNRQGGGYLEIIATDSAAVDSTWTQIPDEDLLEGYYHQQTMSGFPGGAGMDAYMFTSPGYNPSGPTLTIEEADLEDYRGKDVWIRWVFGVEDKQSNNQDGWIVDDIEVLLVDRDTTTALDSIRLDPWGLYPDSMLIQPRYWNHYEFPTYHDFWYYHNLYEIDPIYPYEQGFAWTTWGAVGYIGPWTHGGTNDTWEIGVTVSPLFTPYPDPEAVLDKNGYHYSGNALTYSDPAIDDGFYNDYETSWLMSERYEISNLSTYDLINLRIYRCIRLASNDDAWIHVGFSIDTIPPNPMDLSLWDEVVWYQGENQTYWEEEWFDLSTIFTDALADSSYENYWLIFTLISGPSLERGGWNVDNISIFGAIL